MAKLSEPIKLFIVQQLACYDSPQEIADAVGVEFDVKIDRRQVEEYDPEKRTPGKKWRAVHQAAREAFEQETARDPAALRAVRIRRLGRMARKAEERKNWVLAASLYEQIAKEDGGIFTNRQRHEHTGKGGAPIAAELTVRFVRPAAGVSVVAVARPAEASS